MIYLVASSTDNYWERARPYLASLARHLNAEVVPIIFSVGCDAPPWVAALGLSTRRIDRNGGETQLRSIQHGSFLSHMPTTDPQDLIICTDCDIYTTPSPRNRTRTRMPSSATKKKKRKPKYNNPLKTM